MSGYPGVTWSTIGRLLWITAAVVGGVLCAAVAFDTAALMLEWRRRPVNLRGFHRKVREPWRAHALRLLHPTRSRGGRAMELGNLVLSLAAVAFYLTETYNEADDVSTASFAFTVAVNACFAARYVTYLALTETGRRARYVLTAVPLVDLVSITSALLPVLRAVDTWMTLAFLRVLCAYDSWTNLDAALAPTFVLTRLQRQVLRVALAGGSFIVVMGSVVATVERAGELGGSSSLVANTW